MKHPSKGPALNYWANVYSYFKELIFSLFYSDSHFCEMEQVTCKVQRIRRCLNSLASICVRYEAYSKQNTTTYRTVIYYIT